MLPRLTKKVLGACRSFCQWLDDEQSQQYVQPLSRAGHMGLIWGIFSALLGLDETPKSVSCLAIMWHET